MTAFITKNDFNKMNMQYDSPEGGEGENVNMVVWNYPGNDLTGWVTRSERIVNTAEKVRQRYIRGFRVGGMEVTKQVCKGTGVVLTMESPKRWRQCNDVSKVNMAER